MIVIETLAGIEKWKLNWIQLWQEDPHSTPFNHPDWLLSYAKAFDYETCFILNVQDNELLCIYGLQKNKETLSFIGDPQADYARPTAANQCSNSEIVETLLNGLSRLSFQKILLREFQQKDPLLLALKQLQTQYSIYIEESYPCPRMNQNEMPALFQKKFIKSKNQKRVLTLLKRKGPLNYTRLTSKKDMLQQLDYFFMLHTCRWAGTGETVFINPAMRQFYINLIEALPNDLIHFSCLEQNGAAIAMNLDFVMHKTLYWYKAAFDSAMNNLSPGLGLLCYIGQEMDALDYQILDFTRGTEAWKLRFANDVQHTYNVLIAKNRFQTAAYRLKQYARNLVLTKLNAKYHLKDRLILFSQAVSKYGFRGFLRQLIKKLISDRFSHPEMVIMQKSRQDPPAGLKTSLDDLYFRQGSYSDLITIADMINRVNPARYIQEMKTRLDEGYQVYLGFAGSDLAYALWYILDKETVYVDEIHAPLSLPEGTAYLIDGYTSSKFRGHGVHTAGLEYVVQQALKEKGCTQVIGLALANNTPSIRGFEKSGYRCIGRVSQKGTRYYS